MHAAVGHMPSTTIASEQLLLFEPLHPRQRQNRRKAVTQSYGPLPAQGVARLPKGWTTSVSSRTNRLPSFHLPVQDTQSRTPPLWDERLAWSGPEQRPANGKG